MKSANEQVGVLWCLGACHSNCDDLDTEFKVKFEKFDKNLLIFCKVHNNCKFMDIYFLKFTLNNVRGH